MRTIKKLLFLAICFIIAFSGCKKYDQGPIISILTKKSRVINVWKIERTITNGQYQAGGDNYFIEFKKEGKAECTVVIGSTSIVTEGIWTFDEKKESLLVTFGTNTATHKILKLKAKELWWLDEGGGGFVQETRLIPR